MQEIQIEARTVSLTRLKRLIEDELGDDSGLTLRGDERPSRGVDAAVLVALIGVAGTTVTTLLTGLFKLLEQAKAGRLIIKTADGSSLEIPADCSAEKLSELMRHLDGATVKAVSIDR